MINYNRHDLPSVYRNPNEEYPVNAHGGYDLSTYGYGYAPASRYPYADFPVVPYQLPRIQYQGIFFFNEAVTHTVSLAVFLRIFPGSFRVLLAL